MKLGWGTVVGAVVAGLAAGWAWGARADTPSVTRCAAFETKMLQLGAKPETWQRLEQTLAPLPPGWVPVGGGNEGNLGIVVACETR